MVFAKIKCSRRIKFGFYKYHNSPYQFFNYLSLVIQIPLHPTAAVTIMITFTLKYVKAAPYSIFDKFIKNLIKKIIFISHITSLYIKTCLYNNSNSYITKITYNALYITPKFICFVSIQVEVFVRQSLSCIYKAYSKAYCLVAYMHMKVSLLRKSPIALQGLFLSFKELTGHLVPTETIVSLGPSQDQYLLFFIFNS